MESKSSIHAALKSRRRRAHITINVDGLEVAQSVERQSGQFAL